MGVSVQHSGDFKKIERFFSKMLNGQIWKQLDKYGQQGVSALAAATPKDSSETANSWSYEIDGGNGHYKLSWINNHVIDGVNIAVIIQYGHGTGTGGYVQGRDYINPAVKQVADQLINGVWQAVTSA